MISFLFASFLIAGLAIAWPIYQHFRQERKKIQVVPSLKIFQQERLKVRRFNPRNPWLLLARVLMIIAIVAMIAFPVIKTEKDLSLPLSYREDPKETFVAYLIDDSQSSFATNDATSRLEAGLKSIRDQAESLPVEYRFIVATTSFPIASHPLSKEEFFKRLEQIKPCMTRGHATLAYKSLLDKIGDKLSALVVVSARAEELWQSDESLSPEEMRSVQFIDTTSIQNDLALQEVTLPKWDSESNTFMCRLLGENDKLSGRKIYASAKGKNISVHTISPFEADRGEAPLEIAKADCHAEMIFGLSEKISANSYYYSYQEREKKSGNVLVVCPPGKNYDKTYHIISAALAPALKRGNILMRKSMAQLNKEHITSSQSIVFVGYSHLPKNKQGILNQALKEERHFLFLPPAYGDFDQQGTRVIAWRSQVVSDVDYLKVNASSTGLDLSEFEMLNLSPLARGARHSALFSKKNRVLLAIGQMDLVCESQFSPTCHFIAASIPINLKNPFIYHPAFPLLLQAIVLPSMNSENGDQFFVGDFINKENLAINNNEALRIEAPDGKNVILTSKQESFVLPDTGFYKVEDQNRVLAVNFRRALKETIINRDQWQARFSQDVDWVNPDSTASRPKLLLNNQALQKEYDLTFLFLYAFILFFILEEIFLWNVWRRLKK